MKPPAADPDPDNVVRLQDRRPGRGSDYLEHAYQEYREALRRYLARHLSGREDVADLLQEVYVRLVRYEHPEKIENVQAFLFATASNLMRDKFRRAKTHMADHHVPVDDVELVEEGGGPEKALASWEIRKLMRDALLELDDHCRYAFILHRFDNVTYSEIARRMGTTVGVVRRYVSVALAHCAIRLKDYL